MFTDPAGKIRIAILDDYQDVATGLADWASLGPDVETVAFHDHVADSGRLAVRLRDFDAAVLMRERTPFDADTIGRLPNLKLIATVGMANVAGAVLGVLGLGKIGQAVAKVGQAFGMRVIAWSQNLTAEAAQAHGVLRVDKDELFAQADVLTLHLRLSARTRAIVGARELALMKSSALLVNTSRGPLVDEAALVDCLQARRIRGAALDVFDVEPLPPAHPFRHLPNVVATPHIGYVSRDTYADAYPQIVENIRAWRAGTALRVLNA